VSGGLIFLAILVPTAGFVLWLAGHFMRARRAEVEAILRKGVLVQAEVVGRRRSRVDYQFEAPGWPQPIKGRGRVRRGAMPAEGERIPVRYLPGHPHISTIVEREV